MNQWHGFQALFNQDKPDKPTWENQSLAMGTQAAASKLEQCTRWTSSTSTFYICLQLIYIYIILCYYIYNYIYFYLYTYLLRYLHADLALSSVLCVCGKRNLLPVPPRLVPLKVGDGRCMVVPAGSVGVWPVWPPGGLAPPSIQPPSIAWLGFHHGASLTSSQAQGSFHWELEAETRQGMW